MVKFIIIAKMQTLIIHAGGLREPISESSLKMNLDEDGNERSRKSIYEGERCFCFYSIYSSYFFKRILRRGKR